MDLPLISAILVTKNQPLDKVIRTITCFRNQTYENKELVVVGNNYELTQAIDVSDLTLVDVPDHYTIGLAMNYGLESAKGSIIAQFGADYFHAPERLIKQVSTMANQGAHVVMLSRALQFSGASGMACYNYNSKGAILETMMFVKQDKLTYQNRDFGLELLLLMDLAKAGAALVSIDNPELCCKMVCDLGRAEIQNRDLSEDHYTIVSEIIRQQRRCNPLIQPAS